jgi:hypothetical protein
MGTVSVGHELRAVHSLLARDESAPPYSLCIPVNEVGILHSRRWSGAFSISVALLPHEPRPGRSAQRASRHGGRRLWRTGDRASCAVTVGGLPGSTG